LRTVLLLLKKDILRFLSDKPAMLLTFILPAILILIFGEIFSGNGGQQSRIPVIFINESTSPLAKVIESKIDSSLALKPIREYKVTGSDSTFTFDEKTAKEFVKKGKYSTAVILPADFFADTSAALHIKMFYDPKDQIEYSLIQGNLQEIIYSTIPQVFPVLMQKQWISQYGNVKAEKFRKSMAKTVNQYFQVPVDSIMKYTDASNTSGFLPSSGNSSGGEDFFSKMIKIESKQVVGKEIKNPGTTRMIGGWAIMFLLFSIVGASVSLFEEKQEGSLKRLLCMPVNKSDILVSKYLYTTVLGIIQLSVMFIFAWLVFNVDIFSNLLNLSLIILSSALAAVSFGMLITSFSKSLSQANGIATILILIMSAIGGSWFPVFLLPDWMQVISKTTITYWSVDGFLQVLWRNAPLSGITINIVVLLGIAIVVNGIALYRFKRGNIF
jgi:ABC-2 type transport system permease protein